LIVEQAQNILVFVQQELKALVVGVQATMVEPTIAADGHTYERTAIQDCLTHSRMSPVTGHPLSHTRLVSNQAARVAIASQLGPVQ
jgi:hypothetical protein